MPPDADAPDENIPLQGTHRANSPDDALTSSVRAQEPPEPTPRAERVAEDDSEASPAEEPATSSDSASDSEQEKEAPDDLGDYRLSRDPSSGRHRVNLRPPAEEGETPGGGFREISRHSSPEEMSEALDGQLPDGPRFVVLENTETGEVRVGRGNALGDSWMGEGRYDQATVFESEDEAATYAEQQRDD